MRVKLLRNSVHRSLKLLKALVISQALAKSYMSYHLS